MKLEPHYIIYADWDGEKYLIENIYFDLEKLIDDLHSGQDRFSDREDGCAAQIYFIDISKNQAFDVTEEISDKLGELAYEELRINPDLNPHPLARNYIFQKEVVYG